MRILAPLSFAPCRDRAHLQHMREPSGEGM